MVDTLFIIPLQAWWYSIVETVCAIVWDGARSLLQGGYLIMAVTVHIIQAAYRSGEISEGLGIGRLQGGQETAVRSTKNVGPAGILNAAVFL